MVTVNRTHASLTLLFLVAVSFFGLALAEFFAVAPLVVQDDFVLRKPVAGAALAVVCVLGIVAVLYPDSCAGMAGFKKQGESVHRFGGSRVKVLRGHHAECEPYATHVVKIGGNVFCASCSGLLVGAVIVLVCVGLFFFGGIRISNEPSVTVSVGVASVAAGLLYPLAPTKLQHGLTRFFAGVLLAVGSLLVLVGVDTAALSVSVDLFCVALSVLWLATKMFLSQWEHKKICANCTLGSRIAESAV